ncbi:D-ribose pyranase [Paenibacillus selenitireducens]|uniref:D-ribose pyranase n=1 Tax=Paenibacillus selenitireducens TaxID=1324314 RepID=A0A1T2WZ98_9BACL|nr:D-ribose pyranase [Paenibacillus selenitireducens]OPA72948.1 D-ribose pyranase [Paenibacillus selenitireducens]
MKRNGVLNSHISQVLSQLGHTDSIAIADCGLPIPRNVERIDLVLELGKPSFIDTLKVVLSDMKVEAAVIAEEMQDHNPAMYEEMRSIFGDSLQVVPHSELKRKTTDSHAIIRTGEATPFANIILYSGVIF